MALPVDLRRDSDMTPRLARFFIAEALLGLEQSLSLDQYDA